MDTSLITASRDRVKFELMLSTGVLYDPMFEEESSNTCEFCGSDLVPETSQTGVVCIAHIGDLTGPAICKTCLPDFAARLEASIQKAEADLNEYLRSNPKAAASFYAVPNVECKRAYLRSLEGLRNAEVPTLQDWEAAEAVNTEYIEAELVSLVNTAIAWVGALVRDNPEECELGVLLPAMWEKLREYTLALLPGEDAAINRLWFYKAGSFVEAFHFVGNLLWGTSLEKTSEDYERIDKRIAISDYLIGRVYAWYEAEVLQKPNEEYYFC